MNLYFCKHCGEILHSADSYCQKCGELATRNGGKASVSLPAGTTILKVNFVPQAGEAHNATCFEVTADGKLPALYTDILKATEECGFITVQMLRYLFPVGYVDCCKIMEWMEKNNYIERVGNTNIYKALVNPNEQI